VIPDTSTALNAIAEVPPGKAVPVKVIRRNQEVTLDVLVGKRRPRPRVSNDGLALLPRRLAQPRLDLAALLDELREEDPHS
jgi:hypothetical protein